MISKPFILAEWNNIAMFSWAVDERLLKPFLPNNTALDDWKGQCYISLVALYFQHVKVNGWSIPLHQQFPMINLRFYVRQVKDGHLQKGVVFIREITSKPLISLIAKWYYKEHFKTGDIQYDAQTLSNVVTINYKFKSQQWNSLHIEANLQSDLIRKGSFKEWITERYWGFTKMKHKQTKSFQVWHPRWTTHPVRNYRVAVSFEEVYGTQFQELEQRSPDHVLFSKGSKVNLDYA